MSGALITAHQGVLFLDELPQFDRGVLECCGNHSKIIR
jgi:predicted ATPase with chaperone activity